jgi:hypothetical protein
MTTEKNIVLVFKTNGMGIVGGMGDIIAAMWQADKVFML